MTKETALKNLAETMHSGVCEDVRVSGRCFRWIDEGDDWKAMHHEHYLIRCALFINACGIW